MVESQCVHGPVKAYIMSDLLKKFDFDTTHDFVKIAIAVAGFYMGIFYRMYFFLFLLIFFLIISVYDLSNFTQIFCSV